MKIFVYNNVPNIDVTIGELYQPAAALQPPRYKCPILCPPQPRAQRTFIANTGSWPRKAQPGHQQISGVLCNFALSQLQGLAMIKIKDVDMHEKYSILDSNLILRD